VTSVPVLLFKMRCMFFFTVKTFLCALSEESALSFSSLSANPFLWRPIIIYRVGSFGHFIFKKSELFDKK